jgi:hypothetical protein
MLNTGVMAVRGAPDSGLGAVITTAQTRLSGSRKRNISYNFACKIIYEITDLAGCDKYV